MESKPQSRFSTMTIDLLLPHRSESESYMITSLQKSHPELLNPRRPRAVSDASEGESETDSEEDPNTHGDVNSVYTLSLQYGSLTNETIRYDPTTGHHVLNLGADPRKLTQKSSKPTPTKITKNYKHEKTVLQIADPETAATCSITRVLSCNKTGRKSRRRASFWVGENVYAEGLKDHL